MTDLSRRTFLQVSSAAVAGVQMPWGMNRVFPGLHLGATGGSGVDKASIAFRIGVPQWLEEVRYAGLLELFEQFKGVTDEITFFTSETHPPLPLEVIQQRAGILAQRMTAARSLGYRSGINILATLGHHNENLPNSLNADYTRMTDIGGGLCQGSFCPNDEGLRGYIAAVYRAITEAGPDYIWVDDDVRLYGHMPIRCGCFCDTCLAIFEKESGTKYTRDSLRAAFAQGELPAKLAVRNAWLEHNRATLRRLFALIEETVHGIRPGMPIGFMTGERFFEGFDFDGWAAALSGPSQSEVRWRPGGGQYTDESLDGIAQKAHQIGRQVVFLPPSVVSIQSEVESFPYQRLRKSAHATALEAASYIAGGCTGTAFNVLSMYAEPLDEYEGLASKLREVRPFLDMMARELGRTPAQGVFTGWNKNSFAAANAGFDWFDGPRSELGTGHADPMFTLGIPPAYGIEYGSVTVLTGDTALAFSDADLRGMLSRGAYLDVDALNRLNEMGYGALTGFTVEKALERDSMEEFVEHPLNAGLVGRRRDCRQSFWHAPAFTFSAAQSSCQTLAHLIDYTYQETGACCMGVFENELGGRICISGYYPWMQLHNLSKSSQMKAVMRWLSHDRLPAYVSSFHRVNIWARVRESGQVAMALLNASLDAAQNLEVCVLSPTNTLRVVDMQNRETLVQASRSDGPYQRFMLPPVEPWNMRLAVSV